MKQIEMNEKKRLKTFSAAQRVMAVVALLCLLLCGCKKEDWEATRKYSTKYRVMCGFTVMSYSELMPAVGGFGLFATIRQVGSDIVMKSETGSKPYAMDALQKDFQFGCGGLIVGTDFNGLLCCFDLACPNCDQAQYRMTVKGAQATCEHCGIVYALEYDTYIIDKGNGLHPSPRVLYQYQTRYDGTMIHMYN
jgi:hypothetical protein